MNFTDRNLTCVECGAEFVFTTEEQEFHAARGYTNEPKRCPTCRQARKAQRGNSGYGSDSLSYRAPREMHTATCARCGAQAQVPFRPRGDRPVYCSDCYNTMKTANP